MMPFLRFLSAFLFSPVLITATLYTIIFLNLPSTLYPLTKAFNSAARLVFHTPKFSHISPSLTDLYWLPFHFRSSFKICSLMHEISHTTLPSHLSNFSLSPKRAGLRPSTRSQLFIIPPSHPYAKTAFSFSGSFLWNSLPPNLKFSSYSIFFQKLITYFYKQLIA